MTATCTNSECGRHGDAVQIDIWLAPDEDVYCGECSTPCELAGTRKRAQSRPWEP